MYTPSVQTWGRVLIVEPTSSETGQTPAPSRNPAKRCPALVKDQSRQLAVRESIGLDNRHHLDQWPLGRY
jgi:hypothetical protein